MFPKFCLATILIEKLIANKTEKKTKVIQFNNKNKKKMLDNNKLSNFVLTKTLNSSQVTSHNSMIKKRYF